MEKVWKLIGFLDLFVILPGILAEGRTDKLASGRLPTSRQTDIIGRMTID